MRTRKGMDIDKDTQQFIVDSYYDKVRFPSVVDAIKKSGVSTGTYYKVLAKYHVPKRFEMKSFAIRSAKLKELMQEHPDVKYKQYAEMMGVSIHSIKSYMRKMKEQHNEDRPVQLQD